jgi:hypothetical protein
VSNTREGVFTFFVQKPKLSKKIDWTKKKFTKKIWTKVVFYQNFWTKNVNTILPTKVLSKQI